MNWNIITDSPSWFIIFCLLLGILYALALYYREKKNEFPSWLKLIMGFIRFLVISTISFLLLSPFIRSVFSAVEKPLIIIGQDNSQSIRISQDSTFYLQTFPSDMDKLAAGLSKNFQIRKYTFGENVRELKNNETFSANVNYSERMTDISDFFKRINDIYANRNVGALILATDGIYNTGSNPLYAASKWEYPVYTVAMGDTIPSKDLILAKVNYNRMVYLNSQFPLEIVVNANECQGDHSVLRVYDGSNQVYTNEFAITDQLFSRTFNVVLDARQAGLKKYRIQLDKVPDELSIQNNMKEAYVEVLDAKNRILLLSAAPHPDVAALKDAIEKNFNYQVDDFLLKNFNTSLDKYNLIILDQLPSLAEPAKKITREILDKKLPVLYIVDNQTDFIAFNQLKTGLNVLPKSRTPIEALPELNRGFALFTLSDATVKAMQDFPPLISPFAEYQVANSANVMLYQGIGTLTTGKPLIMFNETTEGRTGIIVGEGIWKWRIMDYEHNGTHEAFDEIFNKIFQYLSVKEQKTNFRIFHKNNFRENEHILFDAEVYNQSYELINDPEVEITFTNEKGNQFPYVFSRTEDTYHLDAGSLPPGNYSYHAKVKVGEKLYTSKGEFSVSRLDLELVNSLADHNLLYSLARQSGGRMIRPANVDSLVQELESRADIKPITYTRKRLNEVVNIKWVLVFIVTLLSLEWFMRKRAGGY